MKISFYAILLLAISLPTFASRKEVQTKGRIPASPPPPSDYPENSEAFSKKLKKLNISSFTCEYVISIESSKNEKITRKDNYEVFSTTEAEATLLAYNELRKIDWVYMSGYGYGQNSWIEDVTCK